MGAIKVLQPQRSVWYSLKKWGNLNGQPCTIRIFSTLSIKNNTKNQWNNKKSLPILEKVSQIHFTFQKNLSLNAQISKPFPWAPKEIKTNIHPWLRLLVIGPLVGFEPRTFERSSFSSLTSWAMSVCSISSAFGSSLIKRMFLIKVLPPDLST